MPVEEKPPTAGIVRHRCSCCGGREEQAGEDDGISEYSFLCYQFVDTRKEPTKRLRRDICWRCFAEALRKLFTDEELSDQWKRDLRVWSLSMLPEPLRKPYLSEAIAASFGVELPPADGADVKKEES